MSPTFLYSLEPRLLRNGWLKKLSIFTATGFKAGNFPFFPGTIGTLVGLIIYLILKEFNNIIFSFCLLFLFFIAWFSIEFSLDFFKEKDPQQIVIDEIIGFLITMFLIPEKIQYIIAGFILFRIIDILKPYPICNIEKMHRANGILFDDVASGIFANLILHTYIYIFIGK
ncbi:MAG: phosphatidylglycerophosphatase A [Candidatus Firestonebacteria bacterium]|nr:phosphatidylglycerophosphatase A [Candidatus Firestonebacteria bacterium]